MLVRARSAVALYRTGRFCNREAIGYLGAVGEASDSHSLLVADLFHERMAVGVAEKRGSARFLCCNAFRIGPAVTAIRAT